MLKKPFLLTITILYMVVLAILSLVNSNSLPSLEIDYGDKIFHVLAYAVLCYLWYMSFVKLRIKHPIIISAILSIIYGIILEVLQGQLAARTADLVDVIANCAGILIVSFFLAIKDKTIVKNL